MIGGISQMKDELLLVLYGIGDGLGFGQEGHTVVNTCTSNHTFPLPCWVVN